MKYAVLQFGYNGFASFERSFQSRKFYSVNIGDNMQTLAVRNVYDLIGIPREDVVPINRDDMASYTGDKAVLVTNGCFYARSFPFPDNIVPVFIGFQTNEETVSAFAAMFKRYEPIGCRDTHTAELMRKYGIKAHTTGCLTLTLPARPAEAKGDRVYIVHGGGSGSLPTSVLAHMPAALLEGAELVFQRLTVDVFPLGSRQMRTAEKVAGSLLNDYRRKASLVVTPLHHAASPCIAAGIPVIICRRAFHSRFSYLQQLLPVYTPERFHEIDWQPAPVDVDGLKSDLVQLVAAEVKRAREGIRAG
ncbi:polysaccharide pyruvyl transferase family protein [Mesorhizobium yinganensis]|uniref:polysaccharide pyruvyl transferase family protein n=1 Tax=Mesorhizobium yinganensis TaxID=3157707 RepID=UPI0032B7912B